ncbi:MAG: hypothetical protein OHK0023_11450 [Anaerolineae bacterium]
MNAVSSIIVLEPRDTWQSIIREALPAYTIHFVQNYDELQRALASGSYHVVLVDVWTDESFRDSDHDDDGTHDSLEALLHLGEYSPSLPVVVVCDPSGRETLLDTPGIPAARFIIRAELTPEALQTALNGVTHPNNSPVRQSRTVVRLDHMPPKVGSRPGLPRVLLVEDQPFWLNVLTNILEEAGYFWRTATTYDAAIGRLKLESFHVVLLNPAIGSDTHTGERPAWQFLDHIAHHSPRTKIIVVSGQIASVEVAKLFMGYQIKGYVDKNTFDRTAVLSMIQGQVATPVLRIQTLGDFRMWRDGRLLTSFGSPDAEFVLKMLITRRGSSVSAEEMASYLPTPDYTEGAVSDPLRRFARLTEAINTARVALEPDLPRPSDSRLILRDGANYRFAMLSSVEIDADRIQHLLEEARQKEINGEPASAMRAYEQIREIYHGDFLPADRASSWTTQERSNLQMSYTTALNRMADLHALEGNLKAAIAAANEALQIDAYSESTYRRLMRYHTCIGDKNAARGVYRTLTMLFSELFNEEISETTRQLYDDIEADRPINCVEVRPGTGETRLVV